MSESGIDVLGAMEKGFDEILTTEALDLIANTAATKIIFR